MFENPVDPGMTWGNVFKTLSTFTAPESLNSSWETTASGLSEVRSRRAIRDPVTTIVPWFSSRLWFGSPLPVGTALMPTFWEVEVLS
ncbi:hypothetical protein EDF69_001901 [Sphingomonas sp. JUb134]|uniref:Uncharacterized protein n=1 Tax=Sphingomonas molluscorum TaxID=418184 RepID=A0ABU8Q4X8_9SPHN|nr:hypothetical protein [Sphingomonas sp. JUb134]MBM7406335.1 hypothetical protein [Sphingomonas sp. JUb134]